MERAQQSQHSGNLSERSLTQPEKELPGKGILPSHQKTLCSAKAPCYGLTKTKMGNNLLMHQCRNYAHSTQQAELLRISLKHFPPFPSLTHPHTHTTSSTRYISCTFGSVIYLLITDCGPSVCGQKSG